MSIVFCLIPELLKPKVKEAFPDVTFLKVDEMDASQHGKTPRKKREKKIPVEVKDVFTDSMPTL
jgi:hypothetical protein